MNTPELIHQSSVKRLTAVSDERGRLMELLRCDDALFRKFGQVYLTTAYPGVVKAWHAHRRQWDHFVCLHGMAKVVLYDPRPESPTRGMINEHFMGVHHPILLQIPPGVMHGFKCISDHECLMLNCPTEPYDPRNPDELRYPAHTDDIPYEWTRMDR